MKKIISIILASAVAVQLAVLPVMAREASEAELSWEIVNGIGLADFDDSQKEEKVTRAEYAQFLAGALGIVVDEEQQQKNPLLFEKAFYSGAEYDSYRNEAVAEETSLYADVETDEEEYEAIKALYNLNIMTGDDEGNFHPERNIRYEEVLKTFVVLASYNVDMKIPGSWPRGYVKLASDLDMIVKGAAIGDEITKYQLCQILYNTFDVEMMKIMGVVDDKAVYETVDGVTFLNEMIGVYAVEGQLEATSNSTILSPYSSKDTNLTIGGIQYSNKTINPIGSMLGRTVKAYRTEDGDVLYMTPVDSDEVETINAEQEPYLSRGVLYYEVNGREKHIDVAGMPIIYNGVSGGVVREADVESVNNMFDIDYGTIVVTEEAKENVVIITDYKDMLPGGIDDESFCIYDKATDYMLDLNEENNTVFIYDENMNRISFNELPSENEAAVPISYIENGTYKEVYFGGKKLIGTVKSIDRDEIKLVIDDSAYEYTDAVVDSNTINVITPGTSVTAYINKFGKVFYIVQGSRVGEMGGILQKAYFDDDDNVGLKIYEETDKFKRYECAEKITFTNTQNYTSRLTPAEVKAQLDNYGVGYIVYTVNDMEKITKIQLPLESKELLREGEEKIYQRPFQLNYDFGYNARGYKLGSQIFLNGETDIFSIPTDTTDVQHYDRFTLTSIPEYDYFSGIAYYKNTDSPLAEAVVTYDRHLSTYSNITVGTDLYIVTDISDTVKGDDELCKEVTLMNFRTLTESKVFDYYENGTTGFDTVRTPKVYNNDALEYKLKEGDFVYCSTESGTNELKDIMVVYSADMESPAGPDAKKGWIPGIGMVDKDNDGVENEYTNKYMIKKSVYQGWKDSIYANDSIFMYINSLSSSEAKIMDTGNYRRYKQNPGSMMSNGNIYDYVYPYLTRNGGYRYLVGYCYDYVDGFLKLTTQDLSVESYNPDATWAYKDTEIGINYEEYINLVTVNTHLVHVKYYDNGIEVEVGYPQDIKTYKKAGKECSRMYYFAGNYRSFNVIINDYRTR